MKVEMLMPQMGESIAEATVLKWLKQPGDEVKKDETILEISTDKVDSEIPSPASGILVEILAEVGKTVAVKSVVAIIETDKAAATVKSTPAATSPAPAVEKEEKAPAKAEPKVAATKAATPPKPGKQLKGPLDDDHSVTGVGVAELLSAIPAQVDDRFYSPLVRSIAAQHGLSEQELSNIRGSGTHGRVTKNDVISYIQQKGTANEPHPAPAQQPKKAETPTPRPQYNADGVKVEPFDNMRKKIAEHMVRSKQTSPHVYTVNEVDLTNVAKWREKVQGEFLKREGFKLSFTPFFIEAAAKALVQYPGVNASVDGESLIMKKAINVGCAVALGTTGLIVPVIKGADQLNLVGIARALNDMAQRARNKKLQPDEIQGGTFTITNPGVFGSIIGYPIISQPQLAIMGVGAIKKRPVVVNDMIAIRDVVYLTLSYDHRVIDGSLGGTFLNTIAKYLENWDLDRPL